MTIVVLPDGRKARFPNDMPREQIKAYIDGKQQPQTVEEARARSNAPEWMKKIADRMVAEGRTEMTTGEKAEAIFRGAFGGASDLGGRTLSGTTFGASDWAARKAGINPTKGIEDMIDNASSDRQAGLIGLLSVGTEMTGAFPTGGAVYKGVGKGLASLPKAGKYLKYATPVVSGAITGGAYGGFQGDSSEAIGRGSARGALFGLVADAVGRGINAGFSAIQKIKDVPRGLPVVVQTDKGTRVLDRAVKESKKIAKEVYGQAPAAKEQVNQRMINEYEGATAPRIDVKGEMDAAKNDYGTFLDTNKGKVILQGQSKTVPVKSNLLDANGQPITSVRNVKKQPSVSDLGINNKLSPDQKIALNKAWNNGAMKLKPDEKIGSMKHIDYMKRDLNDQIAKSMNDSKVGIGKEASSDTVSLMELKKLLKKTTDNAVPVELRQQYQYAKDLQSAYEEGLKFGANNVRTRDLHFSTNGEKSAFTQGLLDKMRTNASNTNIAKEVLKNQDALKQVMPENNFKELVSLARKNNLAYDRLNTLANKAGKTTGAAEAIGKNTGNLTEWGDSKWSPLAATINAGRRILTANSSARAANYLLNPELHMGKPLYDTIQQYLPTSAVILKESKTTRKEKK